MKTLNATVRSWLIENSYEDVAEMIDELLVEWRKNGNKQRRNWWEVLAGDKHGKSRIISGRTFPVLRAAQIRQKMKITENAICRNKNEEPVPIRSKTRWKRD